MNFEIGIDEAGRGAWAGPIVGAALFTSLELPRSIRDSKELSKKQRHLVFEFLTKNYIYGVGIVEAPSIDANGLTWANRKCMERAISNLKHKMHVPPNTKIYVDGLNIGLKLSGMLVPKYLVDGDRTTPCISGASIIAKVTRDKIMEELGEKCPDYGFGKHKGYGTKDHTTALKRYGATIHHRKSFKPIQTYYKELEKN